MSEMYSRFRMSWYVMLWVLATYVTSAVAELTHTCPADMDSNRHPRRGICGKNLSKALALVCGPDGYHGLAVEKRSRRGLWEEEPQKAGGPFVGKQGALSILHKRSKRGITCECCTHRCSYKELHEYCRFPNSKRSVPYIDVPPTDLAKHDKMEDADEATWAGEEVTDEWDNTQPEMPIAHIVRFLLEKPSNPAD